MYYLLSGTHPFTGDLHDIGEHIMNQEVSFDSIIWNLVSSKGSHEDYAAIDLLRKMLEKDPQKRPTAIELTQHLWFSQLELESLKSEAKTQISLHRTVHRIRRNNYKNKERKARAKLEHLYSAEEMLSEVRMEFLVHYSSDTATNANTPNSLMGEDEPMGRMEVE
jgi:serine/threonine protein kinase